jgi:hypothetical protein
MLNDYIREVTYTLNEYPSARPIVSQQNSRQQQQRQNQINRLREQISNNRIKKLYSYIFTGENTDIIKFDMKLERFWQATIPIDNGENSYNQVTLGRTSTSGERSQDLLTRYNMNRAIYDNATARIRDIENNTTLSADSRRQQSDEIKRQQEAAKTALETMNRSSFQVMFDRNSEGQQVENSILLNNRELLQNDVVRSQLTNRIRQYQNTNRQNDYLENASISDTVDTPLPVSFVINNTPTNQNTGTGGTEDKVIDGRGPSGSLPRSRGLVSSILSEIGSNSFFARIQLEIRGDPWWLGKGNVAEDYLFSNITGNAPNVGQPTDDAAWFYNGEMGFILNIRTGEPADESTGFVEFDKSSLAFFGVYLVISVKSKFSNGQFTQILTANKDVLLNDAMSLNEELDRQTALQTADSIRQSPEQR